MVAFPKDRAHKDIFHHTARFPVFI